MKKLLLLFSSLFITLIASAANVPGHFFLDLSDMTLTEGAALPYLRENFAVDNLTEFRPVREYTDELGIKHASYRQYYSGVMVEDALIMVHSRDGVLTSINGCLLETYITPEASALQLRSQSDMGELMIVSKPTPDGIVYVPAYKTYDFARLADVYIDASTGEEIKVVSSVNNISARAYTLYDGWQTCEVIYRSDANRYVLGDQTRSIVTVSGDYSDPDILTDFKDSIDRGYYGQSWQNSYKQRYNSAFARYIQSCAMADFGKPLCVYYKLQNVIISSFPNEEWYSSIFPITNFYIEILDLNGNSIYESDGFSESELPYIFDLRNESVFVEKGYKIVIKETWSGATGLSVNISSDTPDTYTWSHTNAKGSFKIEYGKAYPGTALIQAQWAMKETYDFYEEVFGRKSYDNKRGIIYQIVGAKQEGIFSDATPDNAYATYTLGSSDSLAVWAYTFFGLGDGENYYPFVALDVVAHEFSHNVTKCNGNGGLNYQGESGALNESFSDIMGFSVENYALGDENYEIGEDVTIKVDNLRSMRFPYLSGSKACPDTYKGIGWVNTSDVTAANDNGGVHYNSGVQNKWFYLMNEGGSGTNDRGDIYSVRGIGIEKGRLIAYKNLMNYLIPSATYADARNGSLQAAADLFEKNSTEYQTVMNAWYAVGVGKAYDPSPVEEIAADESSASAYVSEGVIYVACPEASDIAIYAADGSLLHSAANATQTQFPAPAKGIYIVRAGDEVIKIGARD